VDNYTKLHSGQLYDPDIAEFLTEQELHKEKLQAFNFSKASETDKRNNLLKEMFAEIGDNCYIEQPLHANWGGKHVHFGQNIYANSNLTLVDDTHIYIGDDVMIGPNVVITSATHPVSYHLRKQGLQYNLPVKVGNNVWIGSGVQIMPGVQIGDNSVIGAGSVVTKNIPESVVAMGVPCKVVRKIED
jgi:galactoside O-acetyltransferase